MADLRIRSRELHANPHSARAPQAHAPLAGWRSGALFAALALAGACSKGGGGGTGTATPGSQPELVAVQYGRLVDVYGLVAGTNGETSMDLYQRDVLIGPDINDQRGTNEIKADEDVTYDFISSDPDTLQPRLFIPRLVTSDAFQQAFAALDDQVRTVTPMLFGSNQPGQPFSVVPRNAAIRLTFSGTLGIDDGFFVTRNDQGQVIGLRNTEAVQLLRIASDPNQANAFEPLPARVVVADRQLTIDPVLLGSEGLQYQTVNNAAGLPASPDQIGANIRIAVALDGPLALPRLRPASNGELTGFNNSHRNAIVRDFRSGNASDTSADTQSGFVIDPLPLRILGNLPMYLEKVESFGANAQTVTIYKGGIVHDIDRGDVFSFVALDGTLLGTGEVIAEPFDDDGAPTVQHVGVRIRRVKDLQDHDPRLLSGYPQDEQQREIWLLANAPRAVCAAEFRAGSAANGDDPRYFLGFTPKPQVNLDGTSPALNEFVSPNAGAVVRFTKPVDMATVKWADTFFFAMRDLTTTEGIEQFIANRPNSAGGTGMDPSDFRDAKFRTPFLIPARVVDEDGSQTTLRLQPKSGFFLSDALRDAPPTADYRYYVHLISDSADGGVRDLAGNRVDLQGATPEYGQKVVIPFTIDTRRKANGEPFAEDNIVANVVRRFADRDEDPNPSYYLPNEVRPAGTAQTAITNRLDDLVGSFIYIDGRLRPRPTTRTRVVADSLNQSPVGQQGTSLAWCPEYVVPGGQENQIASNSATNIVPAGIQNPLNPYGARLQTLWREVDLSLSRTDAFDFNLDIERLYWAPYIGTTLEFDEFDSVSCFLGHAEYRPVPCVGDFSSLPSLPDSGLRTTFQRNFVWNPKPTGSGTDIESQPEPVAVYGGIGGGVPLVINPSQVVYEPNGQLRYLPLPEFQQRFTFRDETVVEQGCNSSVGSDLSPTNGYKPYILSPFEMGQGRRVVDVTQQTATFPSFVNSFWNDCPNTSLTSGADNFTGGLVGSIALPLIADFWTFCDRADLPVGGGYIAFGTNGWQTAVTVQSSSVPNFRVFTAGRPPASSGTGSGSASLCKEPTSTTIATGGYVRNANGSYSPSPSPGDNTFYWIMMDVVKRQSVITNGFVDINNPHRVPETFDDPRLGPFYLANGHSTVPNTLRPEFSYEFDPPLSRQPSGTSIVAQFRGAGEVDPAPWYWQRWIATVNPMFPQDPYGPANSSARADLKPSDQNFPLDPYKAGDAHIRKWDTRGTPARSWWTYFYNRTVTRYVEDPNELVNPAYLLQFAGPNETFGPHDVRYINWRFVTSNNIDANPPVSPEIETFALSYKFVIVPQ